MGRTLSFDTIAKSHWRKYETDSEHAERVEDCLKEARKSFDAATKPQLAAHRQEMADISPYKGSPKWDRLKSEADHQWDETTVQARELFLLSFEDLLRDGEISEETNNAWDALQAPSIANLDATLRILSDQLVV